MQNTVEKNAHHTTLGFPMVGTKSQPLWSGLVIPLCYPSYGLRGTNQNEYNIVRGCNKVPLSTRLSKYECDHGEISFVKIFMGTRWQRTIGTGSRPNQNKRNKDGLCQLQDVNGVLIIFFRILNSEQRKSYKEFRASFNWTDHQRSVSCHKALPTHHVDIGTNTRQQTKPQEFRSRYRLSDREYSWLLGPHW